jgi:hypothetical protein
MLIHILGLLVFACAVATILLGSDVLAVAAVGGGAVVALTATYGKRRWLTGYIETPTSTFGRWFAGNLPALNGFDRALVHAGAFIGVDGRRWVRANRAVVYGCFGVWASLMLIQAVRRE